MRRLTSVVILSFQLCASAVVGAADRSVSREVVPFDHDWRFSREDTPDASKPDFADGGWRTLDVPHDWMIEQPFDEHSPGGNEAGALNGGVGWYRKTFALPADFGQRRAILEFDGVYMNSQVWLNGQLVGGRPYGYSSFQIDLTSRLKLNGPNVLAVRTEVVQPCSRFYSGAGIYRHVRLHLLDPVHIIPWGTFVTSEVKDGSAKITVRTTIQNDSDRRSIIAVKSVINAPTGNATNEAATAPVPIETGQSHEFEQTIDLAKPALWSLELPQLYSVTSTVQVDRNAVDSLTTSFGIRSIAFSADKGFFLNGQHVPIRGVCNHHDLGALGSAVNRRAIERQLEILKSFGCNAIRTSHNPPAPELLELCDQMGFVVMDEAFDEWKAAKRVNGYGRFFDEWSERDLVSLIHRDRNHPSVIMWSIGNEIYEQSSGSGVAERMSRRLSDICHREDPTRPVTSGQDHPEIVLKTGFSKPLDIFGINYHVSAYTMPEVRGQIPMIGTETSSTVSSRGEYGLSMKGSKVATTQRADHQVTSYDTFFPPWATLAENALITLRNSPWIAGEFVWTGFDYLGEPTPFGWPSRSSYFGIVDLCGFPKDRFYLYQSQWTTKPMVHILPHWNWKGFDGQPIAVWCYTNADSVELFLNDRSLGERMQSDSTKLHVEWMVPYEPGTLKAVAKKNGEVVATDIVATAGEPAKIVLNADRSKLRAGQDDLSFVTAGVVDADGRVCPNASNRITFAVEGPATIAATDNGDATDLDSFQSPERKVFHGLGLTVIRAGREAGRVRLKASASGLTAAELSIDVER